MNYKDEILPLLKKLISIRSDVNDRDACLHILEEVQKELSEFSFTSFVNNGIPSLLYTNTPTPTKNCKIILYAHLDVVPGSEEQFTPIEKDGKLYGRGAYDMKSGGAAMILVFKELAQQLPYTLGLQLTTDEEVVGFNGAGYQLDQGVTSEFVITGEGGTNFTIINQLRGLEVVKLHASGKNAHAGHLWYGENALLKLYEAIHIILQNYPTPNEPSWQTTVSLAKVETTNETHNMVPSDATALLDIRTVPEDTRDILSKIQSLLPAGVTMKTVKSMPHHETEKDNRYLEHLVKAFEHTVHTKPLIRPNYAGSDLIFYTMHNLKGVEFGPKGGGHHSTEEWIEIKNLEEYYDVLKNFLISVK